MDANIRGAEPGSFSGSVSDVVDRRAEGKSERQDEFARRERHHRTALLATLTGASGSFGRWIAEGLAGIAMQGGRGANRCARESGCRKMLTILCR